MAFSTLVALLLGGVLTGTVGGLLGIGGGVFLIPFLVLALDLPMHQAIATSLIAVIATSSAGAALNLERHTVNVRLGMLLETTTVLGALFGGATATVLSGETLGDAFAVLLLVVAALMVWQPQRNRDGGNSTGVLRGSFLDEATQTSVSYTVRHVPVLMGISLVAGNVSGLLGVGGGIFKVPAMTMLGGMPMKAATATSNFMIGVTAAASAFIFFSHGHVDPAIASPTALGVLGGSLLGIRLNRMVESRTLTLIFAGLLLAVSFRMFAR